MATTISSSSSLFSFPSIKPNNNNKPPFVLQTPNNFIKLNLTSKFPRLGISYAKTKGSKHVSPVLVSCLVNDDLKDYAEPEGSSGSVESTNGATIDLKLPRRSLQVHFTCDACGVRSQRLINRLAYEKGLVYVQCSGCSQYHKLVDNLNLMVEYDFREEINASSDTDQA
ncbi:Mitochondrial import protein TIM15 [Artemisia annua]|uniref:Mitochondrial import protein TIM15 n=1 Tax=Artemisia annua TaxID=35608 RepID=A0A2U1LPM2_ARTAN|nr:Mitochondrial import protein TIM15 [Artemisia annua]